MEERHEGHEAQKDRAAHEGMHGVAQARGVHPDGKDNAGREDTDAMKHGGHEMAEHEGHGAAKGHGDHHAHMVADFRKRFWVSLIATVPILSCPP